MRKKFNLIREKLHVMILLRKHLMKTNAVFEFILIM